VVAVLLLATLAVENSAHVSAGRWEYKIENMTDTGIADRLDQLGKQGWEMISESRSSDSQSSGVDYEVILKRPLSR